MIRLVGHLARILFSGSPRALFAKRQRCPFGCGFGTFTPAHMDAHVFIDHAGDRL